MPAEYNSLLESTVKPRYHKQHPQLTRCLETSRRRCRWTV